MDNKIKLNIGGVDLILKTNEDPKYMQQLADEVNARIRELTRNNSYVSTTMASVITALEYCDKLKKNNNENKSLRAKLSRK